MGNVRFVFLICTISMVLAHTALANRKSASIALAERKNSPTQPQHATGKTHVLECGALPGVLGAHFDLEVETHLTAATQKRVVKLCTVIRRAGDTEALRIPLSIQEGPVGLGTKFRNESEDGEMYSAAVVVDDKLTATLEMSNGSLQCKDQ